MAIPGPDPRLLDDLARVAGGAVNIMSGLQEQIRNDVRTRMDEMAMRMDLVPRDDLDRALGMIEKLRARVDALEERLGSSPVKKTAAKKTAVKKKTSVKKTTTTTKKKKKA